MTRLHRLFLGLSLAAAGACNAEDASSSLSAELPDEAVAVNAVVEVEPQHEGTVVVAGDYPVEVVPHASGEVYAYVHGDAPPTDVQLTVKVPVEGRSTGRPVRMRWNADEARYEGRVRRVEIVQGPIDVNIHVHGVAHHGHVEVFVPRPAIVVEVHRDVEVRRNVNVRHSVDLHIDDHHHHGKHKHKHRGHGRGHGHGHGHGRGHGHGHGGGSFQAGASVSFGH